MELMAAVRQSRQMLQEGACEGAVRIVSAAIEERHQRTRKSASCCMSELLLTFRLAMLATAFPMPTA